MRCKRGFLYQGQYYAWQKQAARHAGARPCPPQSFVFYLQNHDQVANTLARRAAARLRRAPRACAR